MKQRNFAEDQRICDAATAGPWRATIGYIHRDQPNYIYAGVAKTVGKITTEADAAFIAEAREGWLAALAEIERLQAECDRRYGYWHGEMAEASELRFEVERLCSVLERMDDRKNPMMPRSEMARLAKEALDYGETKSSTVRMG